MDSLLRSIATQTFPQTIYRESIYRRSYFVGGCSLWLSTTTGSLAIQASTNSATSVQFISSSPTTTLTQTVCSSNAGDLLVGLLSPQAYATTIFCDNSQWTIKLCGTAMAVCIGCSDPCTASCAHTVLNPCSDYAPASCRDTEEGLVRLLVVNFQSSIPVPTVNITKAATSTTSLALSLQLLGSTYGVAYVGMYCGGGPSSPDEIKQQNNKVYFTNNVGLFNVTNLHAATNYSVFILVESAQGLTTSLEYATANSFQVTTQCCRNIFLSKLSPVTRVYQRQGLANGLVFSMDTPPSSSMTVSLYSSTQNVTSSLIPGVLRLSPSVIMSTSIAVSVPSVNTAMLGSLQLVVLLSGAESHLYRIRYPQGNYVSVVSSTRAPSPPMLTSAQFSNDGTAVIVAFDSATNQANINTAQFNCGSLFNFRQVVTAMCSWTSSSTVAASLGGSACLGIGDTVALVGNVLKAACPTSLTQQQCNTWSYSASVSVRTTAPQNPIVPTVVVNGPSVVGPCSSLSIDLTSSSGSGGRVWSSVVFRVTNIATLTPTPTPTPPASSAAAAAATAMQSFLQQSSVGTPPIIAIPQNILTPGYYNVGVTLCNFLGSCGVGGLLVTVTATLLPAVIIPGPLDIHIARQSLLTLTAIAAETSCTGSSSWTPQQASETPTVTWAVYEGNSPNVLLHSQSIQANVFLLAPFTLLPLRAYTVTALAYSSLSRSSNSASVRIYVTQGSLVAVIAGGTRQCVRVSGAANFDASQSFDEDYPARTRSAAGLLYLWSCMATYPLISSTCGLTFPTQTNMSLIRVFTGSQSLIGATSTLTVNVYDRARTASASVTVSIVTSNAPSVLLTASALTMNPSATLLLSATIRTSSQISMSWFVNDTSINLAACALTATSAVITYLQVAVSPSVSVNLPLAPNVLRPGSGYLFTLQVTSASSAASSQSVFTSIEVFIAKPPQPGKFDVTPRRGLQLAQLFQFSAVQWYDSNVPLSYAIYFVSTAHILQLIQPRSAISYGSSLLPAGLDTVQYAVEVRCVVYNVLDINNSASVYVQVLPSVVNTSALTQQISSTGGSSSSNSASSSSLSAVAGSILNAVPCNGAPPCWVLNRLNCSTVANTCGSCVSTSYIGDSGFSNSPCISVSAYTSAAVITRHLIRSLEAERELSSRSSLSNLSNPLSSVTSLAQPVRCTSVSQCRSSWQQCEESMCTRVSKACTQNCSRNGQCTYINSFSGISVPACSVGDPACLAVCSCSPGYRGSSCSYTTSQFISRQSLRSQLVRTLMTATSTQNINPVNVQSWLSQLVAISQAPEEISVASASNIVAIAQFILTAATNLKLSYFAVQNILEVINALSLINAYGFTGPGTTIMTQPRRAIIYSGITSLLASYSNIYLSAAVVGQTNISSLFTQYRLISSYQAIASDGSFSLSQPLTSTEHALGVQPQLLQLSAMPTQRAMKLTMATLNANNVLLGGPSSTGLALTSNILSVWIPFVASGVNMTLTIPNISPQAYTALGSPRVYNTQCGEAPGWISFSCPLGGSVTAYCDGVQRNFLVLTCDHFTSLPLCSLVVNQVVLNGTMCEVVAFSAAAVTCSCQFSARMLARSSTPASATTYFDRRILSSSSVLPSTGSILNVQFAVSTQTTMYATKGVQYLSVSPTVKPTTARIDAHNSLSTLYSGVQTFRIGIIIVAAALLACLSIPTLACLRQQHKEERRQKLQLKHKLSNGEFSWEDIYAESKFGDVEEIMSPVRARSLSPHGGTKNSSSEKSKRRPSPRQKKKNSIWLPSQWSESFYSSRHNKMKMKMKVGGIEKTPGKTGSPAVGRGMLTARTSPTAITHQQSQLQTSRTRPPRVNRSRARVGMWRSQQGAVLDAHSSLTPLKAKSSSIPIYDVSMTIRPDNSNGGNGDHADYEGESDVENEIEEPASKEDCEAISQVSDDIWEPENRVEQSYVHMSPSVTEPPELIDRTVSSNAAPSQILHRKSLSKLSLPTRGTPAAGQSERTALPTASSVRLQEGAPSTATAAVMGLTYDSRVVGRHPAAQGLLGIHKKIVKEISDTAVQAQSHLNDDFLSYGDAVSGGEGSVTYGATRSEGLAVQGAFDGDGLAAYDHMHPNRPRWSVQLDHVQNVAGGNRIRFDRPNHGAPPDDPQHLHQHQHQHQRRLDNEMQFLFGVSPSALVSPAQFGWPLPRPRSIDARVALTSQWSRPVSTIPNQYPSSPFRGPTGRELFPPSTEAGHSFKQQAAKINHPIDNYDSDTHSLSQFSRGGDSVAMSVSSGGFVGTGRPPRLHRPASAHRTPNYVSVHRPNPYAREVGAYTMPNSMSPQQLLPPPPPLPPTPPPPPLSHSVASTHRRHARDAHRQLRSSSLTHSYHENRTAEDDDVASVSTLGSLGSRPQKRVSSVYLTNVRDRFPQGDFSKAVDRDNESVHTIEHIRYIERRSQRREKVSGGQGPSFG